MTRRGRDADSGEAGSKRTGAEPSRTAGAASPRTRQTPKKPPRKGSAEAEAVAARDIPRRASIPAAQATFAACLVRLRKAAGLTQDQLAERSGISQAQISQLERGAWEPRLGTMIALARALGVAPAALLPAEK